MTLRQKQSRFAHLVACLILEAERQGFEVTLAEAYRDPRWAMEMQRQGRGIADSLHTKRLAIDLNLFREGRYLNSTKAHQPLGEWWEAQDPACRWGGRFTNPGPDGNHYSYEYQGRA